MNIKEIRKKFPQYGDLTDSKLLTKIRERHYSDMSEDDFLVKLGLKEPKPVKELTLDDISAAKLKKITVLCKAKRLSTGETVTFHESAHEALKHINKRLDVYRAMEKSL